MSGYTVEVRTGILTGDHNLHTWLHLTRPDGSTEAWGFYPATDSAGNVLYGPGDVKPENPRSRYTATSGPISLTEAQYQSLISHIASMDAAPPDYSLLSLPGGIQCSMWAVDTLQESGLIPEAISPDTTPEFIPLFDTLIWNPLWQSIGFSIQDRVNDWFGNAFSWAPRRDPLTLDLDGDGLETVGLDTARPVHFDHNADGVKTATGWVAPDDGFLVLDRNENGVVDSGAELFGDSTVLADGSNAADGFAALAEQDTNGDGTVDAQDAAWSDLRIWRDLNQNGVSEADELQTLAETGIASLDVEAQSHRQTLSNGNRIADLGRFT
jgi:hypothetical protein